MGELLGITGAIGSGKTTLATYLTNTTPNHAHYETWHVVAEIAAAFNQALKAELAYETTTDKLDLANQVLIWLPDAISEHLHHDVVWNQLAITKHDTLAHPELYEKLFAYLETIIKKRALLDAPLTAGNKEQFRPLLQWVGGYLIAKISRTIWYDELLRRIELHDPTTSLVVIGGVRHTSEADAVRAHGGKIIGIERPDTLESTDITETERTTIKPDVTVVNDGSLEQLQHIAETLINDLAAGHPKQHYAAA
jgi:energy-coupling factor transporter ATP-binding protein EcfA2